MSEIDRRVVEQAEAEARRRFEAAVLWAREGLPAPSLDRLAALIEAYVADDPDLGPALHPDEDAEVVRLLDEPWRPAPLSEVNELRARCGLPPYAE